MADALTAVWLDAWVFMPKRSPISEAKCEVLNRILSKTTTTSGGKMAQRNVARRAHAETNRNQPKNGA